MSDRIDYTKIPLDKEFQEWEKSYKMRAARSDIAFNCNVAFEWEKWANEIPFIKFPSHWLVKIIPPFGGAIIRYRVATIDNPNDSISIYLDCYDMLGSFDMKPYWEIYPYKGDTFRCEMNEIDVLIRTIEDALKERI